MKGKEVNANPFFSIVVPVYNRAELIGVTVRSVLSQVFGDFELIIVDDGSTDSIAEAVAGFSDPRIAYYKKENGERAAARNFGAGKARGRYINFFDSDDLMYENHLATAFSFVQKNKDAVFFHVGYDITDSSGKRTDQETDFNYTAADRLIYTNFLGCNSVFLQLEIARKNPFNEDRRLSSSEDWELWLRIASRYPLYSCDTITFSMINHSGRSLFTISPERILERDLLLLRYLYLDTWFVKKYRKNLPLFKADRYTFFALNFALAKNRKGRAFNMLFQSFLASPVVLTRRRFWASLKHIVVPAVYADRTSNLCLAAACCVLSLPA